MSRSVLVAILVAAPFLCQAEPPSRRLADEGAAALKAGNLDGARVAFERAYRAAPAPRLLYDLGAVARAQGQTIVAADLFRRALAEGSAELGPELSEELRRFLLEPLAPSTEVAVSGDSGAFLYLDDRLLGVLPLPLPVVVSAGERRFRLERDRRKVQTKPRLVADHPAELRFTLVPPVAVLTPTAGALLLADLDGVTEGLRARVSRAAGEAAARERVLLLPTERLKALLSAMPELAGCIERPECQERLALKVQAQYVVSLRVAVQLAEGRRKMPTGQGAWRIALSVYDVAAGARASNAEEECPSCSLEQVAQKLVTLTAKVVGTATTRPRGSVEVESTPAGAEVTLDERRLGPSPQRRAAFAGAHEVRLALPGYEPHRAEVAVSDGQAARVAVTLRKVPEPSPAKTPINPQRVAKQPVPLYRRWWFWTLIGGAAAVGLTSTALLATYGAPTPRTFLNPILVTF